ncbi:plasmid mobilization relaxosome protein MobC [Yinghuangia sp. YIM S10712]|uniref:plasmid mobilization relaxosome protein MobC n=1 Tax=Yinghuangia sp. YIM S10712 TaxID=3436930 RepID=UPI003F529A6A
MSAEPVAPVERAVSARVRRRASATPEAPASGSKRGRRPRRRSTAGKSASAAGGGNHRTGTLKFRVHPDEKAYFEAAAARDGYTSTAAWLERAARTAAAQTEPGRDDQLDELMRALTDTHEALRRIGTNMNQIARAWNTDRISAERNTGDRLTGMHSGTLTELGRTLRRIDHALGAVLDHSDRPTARPGPIRSGATAETPDAPRPDADGCPGRSDEGRDA